MRQMPGGDPIDFLRRAIEQAERSVDGVGPDKLGAQSPCTEWTVRNVIQHMTIGNTWAVAVLERGSAPRPEPTDLLGDDPAGAFRRSGEAMLAAFRAPGALGKMLALPFGTMPGAAFAVVRAIDLLSHTWDVARGSGQPLDGLDPALYAPALQISRATMADLDRTRAPFAPIQPCPDDAPIWDRFAAFHGRDVAGVGR